MEMEKLLKLQCNSVEFEKFRFTLCCSEVSRDLLSRYCINNVTRETAQNALRLSSFFTQCKKSLEFTIFPLKNLCISNIFFNIFPCFWFLPKSPIQLFFWFSR